MSDIVRKLATIEKIELKEHPNADALEIAKIRDWQVVVQKGLHNDGDLVIYCEVDSFLPVREEFEWLRKSSFRSTKNLGDGFRVKTMKLRGEVSQGIVIPLHELPEIDEQIPAFRIQYDVDDFDYIRLEEGLDVTEALGIQKYEKPIPSNLAGKVRGNFPSFLKKTDQERLQNVFNSMKRDYSDHEFEATLKLDGSSMTVYLTKDDESEDGVRFGVCSRNMDLIETEENSFWQVARKLDLEKKLRKYHQETGDFLALQGELMGPGVQGNREGFKELKFFVFDIFNINLFKYISSDIRLNIVLVMELENALVVGVDRFLSYFNTMKSFLNYVDIGSINHNVAEGVVFKSLNDPSVSFKVINNKFLLKEKD